VQRQRNAYRYASFHIYCALGSARLAAQICPQILPAFPHPSSSVPAEDVCGEAGRPPRDGALRQDHCAAQEVQLRAHSQDQCNPVLVAQKVCAGVYKGVTTSQLDEHAAETAAAMTASHPDYASVTTANSCLFLLDVVPLPCLVLLSL
jgi:hypothetical protein